MTAIYGIRILGTSDAREKVCLNDLRNIYQYFSKNSLNGWASKSTKVVSNCSFLRRKLCSLSVPHEPGNWSFCGSDSARFNFRPFFVLDIDDTMISKETLGSCFFNDLRVGLPSDVSPFHANHWYFKGDKNMFADKCISNESGYGTCHDTTTQHCKSRIAIQWRAGKGHSRRSCYCRNCMCPAPFVRTRISCFSADGNGLRWQWEWPTVISAPSAKRQLCCGHHLENSSRRTDMAAWRSFSYSTLYGQYIVWIWTMQGTFNRKE
jgi:hypothetical protein